MFLGDLNSSHPASCVGGHLPSSGRIRGKQDTQLPNATSFHQVIEGARQFASFKTLRDYMSVVEEVKTQIPRRATDTRDEA